MTMNAADHSDEGALHGPAVLLFHSLADPVRLAIIRVLTDGEQRVVDLTRHLGLAQSTVSGHLASLRTAGLVEAHPHGRSTYYALARPEVWEVLTAAARVMGATARPAHADDAPTAPDDAPTAPDDAPTVPDDAPTVPAGRHGSS